MIPCSLYVCLSSALLWAGAYALPQASNSDAKIFKREENGITYNVYEHAATNSTLSFVQDSGICETTPGVSTFSGYLSVGTNMSMFFWLFEARNNSSTAPLALWLNGGPGCSSMIGLFEENGPCNFPIGGPTDTPTLNPYSFNNYANMLYVDQPIGTGFSYGTESVNSTVVAATYVWTFLQAFFEAFPKYQSRDFGFWSESYGGRYGPKFTEYFESQNKAIMSNTTSGEVINVIALGVNNGWIDPLIQYGAYVEYGQNNPYRQLINDTQATALQNVYETECLPLMKQCLGVTGTDDACMQADNACYSNLEGVVENGPPDYPDFDVYDIRQPANNSYPPSTYIKYLQRDDIRKAIGAQVQYTQCAQGPYANMFSTGDDARPFVDSLSSVIQSGVNTIIWAGTADWLCNYIGIEKSLALVQYNSSADFATASLSNYTMNGVTYGEFKTAGNLNYLRIANAGHEVMYYQPEVSLQVFIQIMQKKSLQST